MYVTLRVDELPTASVAVTRNLLVPTGGVLIRLPFRTAPHTTSSPHLHRCRHAALHDAASVCKWSAITERDRNGVKSAIPGMGAVWELRNQRQSPAATKAAQ